jgi:hypothetical protein
MTLSLGLFVVPRMTASALDFGPLDPTKLIPAFTRASINVHNNYPFAITVEMDNGRENHAIASGGVATFTEANKGDRPTFRASKEGTVVNSKQVFLDGNKTVNFP